MILDFFNKKEINKDHNYFFGIILGSEKIFYF